MKRTTQLVLSLILLAGVCFGQQGPVSDPPSALSFVNGMYYAPNFGKWQGQLANSITATGSQSFTTVVGFNTTSDGLVFVPYVVRGRITVGTGSTADTVTISAVSGCTNYQLAGQTPTCTVTATSFANSHYPGEPIASADSGIMEATAYASEAGGGQVHFMVDCGIVTLSTSTAATTSTCYVPNLFFAQGSATRVTTTIATATNYEVGVTGALNAFSTASTGLTAGNTNFITQGVSGYAPVALVTSGTSADIAAIVVTTTGSQTSAGAIHTKVWGYTPAMPAY